MADRPYVRIYRYEIPVNDQWHEMLLLGDVLHVAARRSDVVEIWALANRNNPPQTRQFRVFGTGQPLPDEPLRHVGTTLTGGLVWHLMERSNPPARLVTEGEN